MSGQLQVLFSTRIRSCKLRRQTSHHGVNVTLIPSIGLPSASVNRMEPFRSQSSMVSFTVL